MTPDRRTTIAAVCFPPFLHLGIWIPTISAVPVGDLVADKTLGIKFISIAGRKIRALLTRVNAPRSVFSRAVSNVLSEPVF